jgi:hypothetical protein
MKNNNSHHGLPDELFVVQLDGHVKSTHGRFVEALRVALSLRDAFPQHEVRVRATPATLPQGDAKQRTTLH